MFNIAKAVQERVKGFHLGHVFSVDEFTQLGKTEVVYQELYRLTAKSITTWTAILISFGHFFLL